MSRVAWANEEHAAGLPLIGEWVPCMYPYSQYFSRLYSDDLPFMLVQRPVLDETDDVRVLKCARREFLCLEVEESRRHLARWIKNTALVAA